MHPGALFEIFGLQVHAYGLFMALGLVACFGFLMWAFTKQNFNENSIDTILFVGVFGAGIGIFSEMLFQSFYNWLDDTSKPFQLGGMTFLGGLIGGVVGYLGIYFLYIYVIAPRTKIKWLQNNMNAGLTDALPLIPIGIVIAHSFGRIGCLFAGCCHGAYLGSDYVFGGIYMQGTTNGWGYYVPVQLYEAIFLAVLGAVMALLYFKFNFKQNLGVYCIGYGVWRFIVEYLRTDERGTLIPGVPLYPSQILSIVMVAAGVGFFFLYKYVLKDKMKHPELQPPVREKKFKTENTEE